MPASISLSLTISPHMAPLLLLPPDSLHLILYQVFPKISFYTDATVSLHLGLLVSECVSALFPSVFYVRVPLCINIQRSQGGCLTPRHRMTKLWTKKCRLSWFVCVSLCGMHACLVCTCAPWTRELGSDASSVRLNAALNGPGCAHLLSNLPALAGVGRRRKKKSIVFSSSCDHCACETAAVGMEMDTGSPASDLPLLQHKGGDKQGHKDR